MSLLDRFLLIENRNLLEQLIKFLEIEHYDLLILASDLIRLNIFYKHKILYNDYRNKKYEIIRNIYSNKQNRIDEHITEIFTSIEAHDFYNKNINWIFSTFKDKIESCWDIIYNEIIDLAISNLNNEISYFYTKDGFGNISKIFVNRNKIGVFLMKDKDFTSSENKSFYIFIFFEQFISLLKSEYLIDAMYSIDIILNDIINKQYSSLKKNIINCIYEKYVFDIKDRLIYN